MKKIKYKNPAQRPEVRKKISEAMKGKKNGLGNFSHGRKTYDKYGRFLEKGRKKEYLREWKAKKRKILIDFMGGKCVTCGFDDMRALQIDHINGGGAKHRKTYNGNYMKFNRDLLNGNLDKSLFQLLCANCNFIKKITNNEDDEKNYMEIKKSPNLR